MVERSDTILQKASKFKNKLFLIIDIVEFQNGYHEMSKNEFLVFD